MQKVTGFMRYLFTYINFVKESAYKRGILFTVKLIFWELMFDIIYGLDTFSIVELDELQLEKKDIKHGKRYQASNFYLLKLTLKSLEKCGFTFHGKNILDLGSGKGRVLIMFAEMKVEISIGVEISNKLNIIAEKNSINWLRKNPTSTTKFQFITTDAASYKISEDVDLLYLNNPFDETILKDVVINIKESYYKNPRQLFIVYLIPIHKNIFLDDIFNQVDYFKTDYIIYKTKVE